MVFLMKKKTVYFSIHHLPQWLLLFSLLVSNVLFPVAAMADTGGAPLKEVWVDDDYSSSNDGEHTWSYDAFNNIQSGIDAVGADGTVHVAGGTYYALHEGDTILVNKSVKLVGEGKDTTFVDGRYKNDSLYSYNSYPIFHITASNVSISGFTIQNSGSGDYGAIYVTNGASNITIEENIFKNNIGDLYIDGESGKVSQKITFSGNIVSSDNGDPSIETWAI